MNYKEIVATSIIAIAVGLSLGYDLFCPSKSSKPQQASNYEFHYDDKVKVISGFYEGQIGVVSSNESPGFHGCSEQDKASYDVLLSNNSVVVLCPEQLSLESN